MILLAGQSRDTSVERFLCERQQKLPGSSASGMKTKTKLVVEPTVIPSATNLENQMPVTHVSSEPTPVPVTDKTQDRESFDMENL